MGSSIAFLLLAHRKYNKHSKASTEGRKDLKLAPARLEDEKERLECHEDDDDENLTFFNFMKAMELSVKFRMPHMEKYNGREDPTDHIIMYKTKLQGNSSAVKCRNFHTTLTSDAKRWYNKLKLESIKSWPQLKWEFINAFISNQTMVADIAQLYDIWQKEGESMKSYFKRFSNVINKIESVTDNKALDALRALCWRAYDEFMAELRKSSERRTDGKLAGSRTSAHDPTDHIHRRGQDCALNILFGTTFDQMDVDHELIVISEPLFGFTEDSLIPRGRITLAVDFEEPPCHLKKFIEFLVVNTRFVYHGVLGRPALKDLQRPPSMT
ncbi:Retrotrans gag domain-containing protein [Abeliophyllum distichum]|uniref:Retrotrans gag domain-containing protein n=1 Tax=Abeliophyllum distichum TaxID=126358 RepID=A0ABD1Q3F8_9LAMI